MIQDFTGLCNGLDWRIAVCRHCPPTESSRFEDEAWVECVTVTLTDRGPCVKRRA
jgi:hypothetical protein